LLLLGEPFQVSIIYKGKKGSSSFACSREWALYKAAEEGVIHSANGGSTPCMMRFFLKKIRICIPQRVQVTVQL
jgi:hypothetical protein